MKSLAQRRRICNQLGDRYYPPARRRDVILEETIAAHLEPGAVFLDAGSGPALRLAGRFAGRTRLSVGLDREPFPPGAAAAPRGGAARAASAVVGDLGRIPLADESVDLIAMRSVVEHLDDPPAVLAGMRRVLKPGGWIVALAPSRWYYASIIGRLLPARLARATLELIFGPTAYDNYPTWYRANTPRAMRAAARRAGLDLVEARVCPHPPDYLKFSPALFRLGVLFDRFTAAAGLAILQPSFLFLLRRP